jgi:hypothetical protein
MAMPFIRLFHPNCQPTQNYVLPYNGLATSQTAGTLNEMRNIFQAAFFFTSAVLAHENTSKLKKRIKHIFIG